MLSIALVSETDGSVLEVVHALEHDTVERVKLRLRARGCHKIADGQLVRALRGSESSGYRLPHITHWRLAGWCGVHQYPTAAVAWNPDTVAQGWVKTYKNPS